MRRRDDFDWRAAWIKAIQAGTALCRACGDPAARMKLRGLNPGCYCRVCYGEVKYGNKPVVTSPQKWKRIRYRG